MMTGFVAAKVLAGPKSSPLINNMPVTAVIEETNAARTTLVLVDVRVVFEVLGPRLLTESVLGAAFDHSIGISRIPSPSDSHRQTLQQWGKIDGVGISSNQAGPEGLVSAHRRRQELRVARTSDACGHRSRTGFEAIPWERGPVGMRSNRSPSKKTDHAAADDVRCS